MGPMHVGIHHKGRVLEGSWRQQV